MPTAKHKLKPEKRSWKVVAGNASFNDVSKLTMLVNFAFNLSMSSFQKNNTHWFESVQCQNGHLQVPIGNTLARTKYVKSIL